MHRGHAVEHALQAVRECVVGQVHIGEQRITPEIGDLAGIKDRAQRRLLEVGDVRVPGTPEIAAVILGLGQVGPRRPRRYATHKHPKVLTWLALGDHACDRTKMFYVTWLMTGNEFLRRINGLGR